MLKKVASFEAAPPAFAPPPNPYEALYAARAQQAYARQQAMLAPYQAMVSSSR